MKPINEMNLQECLDAVRKGYIYRLKELAVRIHELTRWIPVEERMPTDEDADENGEIYIWSVDGSAYIILLMHALDEQDDYHIGFTHWRRIDKPEGV